MNIKQAVAPVTTNDTFKNVIENLGHISKREFLRFLQVDLKTVGPIKFIGNYSKVYENNTFLFIDKEFKVIGMLKGNKWDKSQSNLEYYSSNPTDMYGVVKNWKNMNYKAFHTLMFTPEMKIVKNIKSVEVLNRNNRLVESNKRKDVKYDFKNRLLVFKIRKYDSISHEMLLSMSTQMMEYLVSIMFNPTEFERYKPELRKTIGWHIDNQFSVLEYVTKAIKDYMNYYERWMFEKESIHYNVSYDFTKDQVNEHKIQIMNYWNILKKGI